MIHVHLTEILDHPTLSLKCAIYPHFTISLVLLSSNNVADFEISKL